MTSFLLIISFLLHLITLAVIMKLFQQLQQTKQPDTTDTKEVQKMLESYLNEIKAENRTLENRLAEQTPNAQEQIREVVEQEQAEAQAVEAITEKEDDFIPQYEEKGNDTVEASLESRVMQLHAAGQPVEKIARQLGCGKTEAEIIIKMHQKNL